MNHWYLMSAVGLVAASNFEKIGLLLEKYDVRVLMGVFG